MAYKNPLRKARGLRAGRIDMGVDYSVTEDSPIYSPGFGQIVRLDTHSTWPGSVYIAVKLKFGKKAGKVIYFAENIHPAKGIALGKWVTRYTKLAVFSPGFPNIEIGWAKDLPPVYPPKAYGCYQEGQRTEAGDRMSEFLHSLGAPRGLEEGRDTVCKG